MNADNRKIKTNRKVLWVDDDQFMLNIVKCIVPGDN